MRSIRIDFGPDPVDAASSGFAGRAATPQTPAWSPDALAAAGPLGKIIKASNELEAALAGRARPAVSAVHMPSVAPRAPAWQQVCKG
jgi:hypothetical protein